MSRSRLWLILICAIFLIANLLTATRYPSTWVDEVQFTDPAVNLALGHGFNSSVWIVQDSSAFWAGNAPLYPTLLAGWLKLFGFSPLAARSFNYVLTVLLVFLFWEILERRLQVQQGRWKLWATALILCGHAVMFSFRMGRYDVVGMVLAALAALAWSPLPSRYRTSALILLGAAMPFAGLQLIPGTLLFLFLLFLFRRQEVLRPGLALSSGLVAGGFGLYVFYKSHGVWEAFRASTSSIGVIGQSLAVKLAELPHVYVADKSGVLILATAALLLLAGKRYFAKAQRPLLFGVIFALALPAILQCIGKYPLYYNWMAYLPLVAVIASHCEENWKSEAAALRLCVVALAGMACLVGLPARIVVIALNWDARQPGRLQQFVENNLSKGDHVLIDFKAYYAAKKRAASVYTPTYLGAMTQGEKRRLTTLLIRADDLHEAEARLGRDWVESDAVMPSFSAHVPRFLGMQEFRDEAYEVRLYRRRNRE